MTKRSKTSDHGPTKPQTRELKQDQVHIVSEANYIIKRAQNHDSRMVRLGSLLFFSTETGDAWLLDTEDELALCLARDGESQPFGITETATSFNIAWNAEYRIDGETFTVIEPPGRIRTILGYPTGELLRAIQQL